MNQVRVNVILVNYGQWELTKKCIDSLDRSDSVDIRITLIDNCSPEPVPSWVVQRDDINFRRMEENTGFAGGNNAGFSMSLNDAAAYTFFLNNDAEVLPETVINLARYLERNKQTGIVAPAVYWTSDPEKLWSAGGNLVRWKMRFEQVDLPDSVFNSHKGVQVDFVSGCALMIRTCLFREIRGFRDDFFMYYEDADLCRKAAEHGYSVEVLPSETVLHSVASGSGGELSKTALYFSERNRIVLSKETLSPLTRSVFILYKTAVLLVLSVKFMFGHRSSLIRWIWRGYIDGILGRTGYSEIIGRIS